jgi:hypothetical protein
VQLKETTTKTNAIKKIPIKLLVLALVSNLLLHEEGSVISKAPKSEIPNIKNTANTKRLNHILDEITYMVFSLKNMLINKPTTAKIPMIERE